MGELGMQLTSELLGKEGLVFDIRYNGGGWASSLVVGLLNRPVSHMSSFRGRVTTANATVHGVSVVNLPTVLVQNEQCLSDAENFSEAYRNAQLGLIVGMPTAAWNAGTRRFQLFNGTKVRVGAWKTFSRDGEDMDKMPRRPDIRIDRPIGQGLAARDDQLAKSVDALIAQLDDQ